MSDDAKLERILQDWARSGVLLEHEATTERRRDRVVPRIAESIRRHAENGERRRRQRRWAFAISAAALIAIGVSAFATRPRAAPPTTATAAPAPTLAVGGQVDTEQDVQRTLEIGPATVELSPSSRITLLEAVGASQLIRLDAGEIAVHVKKLQPPVTFSIQTADARVVVRGTRFVVRVLGHEEPSPRTRVHVSEGVVSVIFAGTETLVSGGASWPGPTPTGAKSTEPTGSELLPPNVTRARSRPEPPSVPSSAALAEQNQLFSAAVAARRRGDDRGAVAELDRLLRKYPNGPLAPEARVERFRALKRLGEEDAAAREAKKYLLENKDGFARDEARELVLPPTRK